MSEEYPGRSENIRSWTSTQNLSVRGPSGVRILMSDRRAHPTKRSTQEQDRYLFAGRSSAELSFCIRAHAGDPFDTDQSKSARLASQPDRSGANIPPRTHNCKCIPGRLLPDVRAHEDQVLTAPAKIRRPHPYSDRPGDGRGCLPLNCRPRCSARHQNARRGRTRLLGQHKSMPAAYRATENSGRDSQTCAVSSRYLIAAIAFASPSFWQRNTGPRHHKRCESGPKAEFSCSAGSISTMKRPGRAASNVLWRKAGSALSRVLQMPEYVQPELARDGQALRRVPCETGIGITKL